MNKGLGLTFSTFKWIHFVQKDGALEVIMIICPCNEHPLTPNFYIVKLGFIGVYIFLIFALKHRLWVLVRPASVRRF